MAKVAPIGEQLSFEADALEPKNRQEAMDGEGQSNNLIFDHYFGTVEKTEQVSSHVQDTYYNPYNPDDLYQRTGDHSIYEEMAHDDQVSVCLQLKNDLVVGSGWDIVTEDDDQMEVQDAIYCSLEEDPDESLDDYLALYLSNADTFGWALAEKLFQRKQDGMLTLKSLKTRHPDSFLIYTDDKGNVEKYVQMQASSKVKIAPKALMHYTPNMSTVGPYGQSPLRKVYSAYFTKRHITRFYSIFLEAAAKPIPVAKYDKNLPDKKVTQIHSIIKRFQAKTALTIPKDIEVEFLEATSQGDAYIKGINLFNMFIGRGLFVPDLLGFTGEGAMKGGSQALGKEQVEIFMKHIARRRRSIERLINRHIIQPIIIHNYGFMPKFPKFQFRPLTEDDTKEYAKIFIEAVKGKFYNPTEEEVNHLRGLLKFPEGEVDLIPSGTGGGGTPLLGPGGQPLPPNNPDGGPGNSPIGEENGDKNSPEDESGNVPGTTTPPVETDDNGDAKETQKNKKDRADYVLDEKPIPLEQRPFQEEEATAPTTDFKALDSQLNASIATAMAKAKPIVDDIFSQLVDQMEKKKVLKNPGKLNELKLRGLGKLQRELKANLLDGFKKHSELALAEIIRTDFRTPLPADEFLNLLEQETFQYVGDWEYEVTKGARLAAQNAVRDGLPISAVLDMVEEETKKKALVSLERFSRTKHTEVMNRARMAMFDNSRVVDAVRFMAVLDGRTTTVCAGLHGKVFKKGTEPVPPLHFNCRSVLVPLTVFQDKEIDEKAGGVVMVRDPKTRKKVRKTIPKQPIDQFIEENKGAGFARR